MTWDKCLETRDRRSSSCEGRFCGGACRVPLLLLCSNGSSVFIEPSFFGTAYGEGLLLSEYGRACPRSRHSIHIEGLTPCVDLILSAHSREVDGTGAMIESTTDRDTCRSKGLIAGNVVISRSSSHRPNMMSADTDRNYPKSRDSLLQRLI